MVLQVIPDVFEPGLTGFNRIQPKTTLLVPRATCMQHGGSEIRYFASFAIGGCQTSDRLRQLSGSLIEPHPNGQGISSTPDYFRQFRIVATLQATKWTTHSLTLSRN